MLKISNLTKKYKEIIAVDNFDFEIKSGHIYGIIGPNGAGKTTFFKLLAGLAVPTSGKIIVSTGESIETFRRRMSFMIENPYLYESMTALENIKIIGGIKGETNDEKLKQLLELVKIDKTGKKKVKQFSLGMKQRLGIACALASNPEVLILDEPMNGVDPEGIVELREMLLGLCQERNITLLISSHILGELFQLSSDFIFIKSGKMIDMIDKETLKNASSSIIEIGTTDIVKTYEYLKNEYGDDAVYIENNLIKVKRNFTSEAELSRKITDAGFGITKLNVLSLDLEQYYMRKIIGNEEK